MATNPTAGRSAVEVVYDLLRAAGVADVSHDDQSTVTAGPVRVHINPDGIAVAFTNPYTDLPATVHIAPRWYASVAALVAAGLITQLASTPTQTRLSDVRARLVELHATYDRRLDDENADRQLLLEDLLRELYLLADDLGDQEVPWPGR